MKIIATLGPKTTNKEVIKQLIDVGVDIFRLNFSHFYENQFNNMISIIRSIDKDMDIMADLQGKKVRVDESLKNVFKIYENEIVYFCGYDGYLIFDENNKKMKLIPLNISSEIISNNNIEKISMKDGTMNFKVIDQNNGFLKVRVINDGIIRGGKGCNIPGIYFENKELTKKDKKSLKWAIENNIKIIGDLPIYVSYDSADVWAHPEEFQLDENLCPIEVAGCPPDGFSADGQLWGNPLFNWDYMKETGYQWWVNRIAYQSKIYDVIRIDHFRGFDEYYAIPYGDSTAKNGYWKPGPGMDLFTTIENKLGKLPIIAEDLGFLTDSVKQLLSATGFPGMKVLEFAFDSRDTGSGYLPHCYPNNCIVYTGTHDNDTILGWFETAPEEFQNNAIRYLRLTKEEGYHIGMMRCAWASVADTAIMQMQDFLGLGVEGRMNTPSTLGGNWTWRCLPGDYNDELADWLYEETKIYGRLN